MSLNKKRYELFARFFEKPTRESLRELLKKNTGETDYLDFKGEWPEYTKLAKHVLAFSNSGGGALIIGVKSKEKDDGTKDGTLEAAGITKIIDKSEISKALNKYVPTDVVFEIIDFSFDDSEYPTIKGKKFQVMLVEYDPKLLPILSLKEGKDIKPNVVYVRRGTSSDEANHEELQKIINERIETGYSSKHLLELSDHLGQLKTLYINRGSRLYVGSAIIKLMGAYDGTDAFMSFVDDLIKRKKRKIEEVLDLIK
jgi:predicted HTH transcriptional regulator